MTAEAWNRSPVNVTKVPPLTVPNLGKIESRVPVFVLS